MNQIIKDLSWEDYLRIDAEHATRLRLALISPLHYHDHVVNGRPPTKSQALGVHAHAMTLEPEKVDSTVLLWDGKVKRGNYWDLFESMAKSQNKRIVTPTEHEKAKRIADAVHAHPIAHSLLEQGSAEVSILWQLGETAFKGRVDWHRPGGLVGLKTSADPTDRAFRTAAEKFGYILQWGMYALGWRVAHGEDVDMHEIVVGAAPPHEVFVYHVPQDIVDLGIEQFQEARRIVAACNRTGEWPGRGKEIIEFRRADWAVAQEDNWEMQEAE